MLYQAIKHQVMSPYCLLEANSNCPSSGEQGPGGLRDPRGALLPQRGEADPPAGESESLERIQADTILPQVEYRQVTVFVSMSPQTIYMSGE